MIEKIYKKKAKSKKVIYENVRLSHTPNIFVYACLMQPIFAHYRVKTNVSRTRNECLRRVLRLNAMF